MRTLLPVPLVFYPGPPKRTDLNFIPRVFGRYANGASAIHSDRVLLFGSRAHFLAASHAWLTLTRKKSS